MANDEQKQKRERAIRAIAKILYAETMMAEDFSELSQGERDHYLDLAEKCFAEVASAYDLNAPDAQPSESSSEKRDAFVLDLSAKAVPFRELPVGAVAAIIDRIDDGDGGVEMRVSLKSRAEGVFASPTEPEGRFIPSYSLGLVQGVPGQFPRYVCRPAVPPCLNATAASIAVVPVSIPDADFRNGAVPFAEIMIPDDPKAANKKQAANKKR